MVRALGRIVWWKVNLNESWQTNSSDEDGDTPSHLELQPCLLLKGVTGNQQRKSVAKQNRESFKTIEDKAGSFSTKLDLYHVSSYCDNTTIVYIARQLYTHSKNVSMLCFLYTKGSLSSPWQI